MVHFVRYEGGRALNPVLFGDDIDQFGRVGSNCSIDAKQRYGENCTIRITRAEPRKVVAGYEITEVTYVVNNKSHKLTVFSRI